MEASRSLNTRHHCWLSLPSSSRLIMQLHADAVLTVQAASFSHLCIATRVISLGAESSASCSSSRPCSCHARSRQRSIAKALCQRAACRVGRGFVQLLLRKRSLRRLHISLQSMQLISWLKIQASQPGTRMWQPSYGSRDLRHASTESRANMMKFKC